MRALLGLTALGMGLALLAAAPGRAAVSACTQSSAGVICQNTGSNGPKTYSDMAAQAEATKALRAANERTRLETQADVNADSRRQQAGEMVADGHCQEAQQYALREGDFALAKEIKGYCAAPAGGKRAK